MLVSQFEVIYRAVCSVGRLLLFSLPSLIHLRGIFNVSMSIWKIEGTVGL